MYITFKTNLGEVLKGKMIDTFMRWGYEKVYKVNVKGDIHFVEFWKVNKVSNN